MASRQTYGVPRLQQVLRKNRKIVGWSMGMGTRLVTQLIEDALTMAIRRCKPPQGVIHHSDRGSCILGFIGLQFLSSNKTTQFEVKEFFATESP